MRRMLVGWVAMVDGATLLRGRYSSLTFAMQPMIHTCDLAYNLDHSLQLRRQGFSFLGFYLGSMRVC